MKQIIIDTAMRAGEQIALAAALRSPSLEVLGICCSGAFTDGETSQNTALRIAAQAGARAGIYPAGAPCIARNLWKDRLLQSERTRETLETFRLAAESCAEAWGTQQGTAQNVRAACFYIHCLQEASAPVTVLVLGPMTNLAVALMADPALAEKIDRVIFAAGGYDRTDVTVAAEANVWADPEAAQYVLQLGVPVTFVTLDAAASAKDELLAALPYKGLAEDSGSLKAVIALCGVLDEAVLAGAKDELCIISTQDISDGRTVIDPRYYTAPKNCKYLYSADGARCAEIVGNILGKGV